MKYKMYVGWKVYLASDSSLEIFGRGSVKIQFPDRRIKIIDGVMHILGLARNFLSVINLNYVGL